VNPERERVQMSTDVAFNAGKPTKCTCKCGRRKRSTSSSGNTKDKSAKGPVAVSFAEDVMKSMIARVKKSESDAINAYCTALINDKFTSVKEDISDLRNSVNVHGAKFDHLQEDVHCVRNELAESIKIIKAELSTERNVSDKSSMIPDHRKLDFEDVLSKMEDLIGGLLTDMSDQKKEMSECREMFDKM
jgi:hypothetical protein